MKEILKEYPDVLTITEVMDILGVHKNYAYSLMKNQLGARKIGKKLICLKIDLIKLLTEGAV